MQPRVVVVGRPNVGKSTLFNRLVGRRISLVADTPGVTRDRNEQPAMLRGRSVLLVDTAGLEESPPETISGRMHASSATAVDTADLVLFVVDGRSGLSAADRHFARWLHRQGKPVLLVVNKAEGRTANASFYEAYELGLGEPIAVSAEHGEGIAHLMAEIAEALPPVPIPVEDEGEQGEEDADRPIRLAIVGRPNAGKSTLLNRLIREDRVITGPEPGLTRDAVKVRFQDENGRAFELVDTAGLRRRSRIEEPLEKMSSSAAIEALKSAEVVLLTVDATDGLHDQDLQIWRLIESEGRACVLVLNKWDSVTERSEVRQAVLERLETLSASGGGVAVVFISALTGAGVDKILPEVTRVWQVWNTRVQTSALNRWFESALARHQPPLVAGRRLKLRYITQARSRPPTFVVFGTRSEETPEAYRRYLSNSLREEFGLKGTPIRLHFRQPRNPYVSDERG
jgi:GTP-binding protein